MARVKTSKQNAGGGEGSSNASATSSSTESSTASTSPFPRWKWKYPRAELDLRALACLRIGLGVLLLGDLYFRAQDLVAHYTDQGVLPSEVWFRFFRSHAWRFCLHVHGGSTAFEGALFGLAALLACLLIAGVQTRIVAIASWVLVVSVQNRNPMLLAGGDTEIRMVLFWSLFLPLGERFSFDAGRRAKKAEASKSRPAEPPSNVLQSFGTIAYTAQIAVIYVATALIKDKREWFVDANAVYYALHIDQYTRPWARVFLGWPALLPWLTRLVWMWEAIIPFALFLPMSMWRTRLVVVASFFVVHLSFGTTMMLGLFPLISAVAVLAFLPSELFDRVGAWLAARHAKASPTAKTEDEKENASEEEADEPRPRRVPPPAQPGLFDLVLRPIVLAFGGVTLLAGMLSAASFVRKSWHVPKWTGVWLDMLRLEQDWGMFAPRPSRGDGYFVMPGDLENGLVVELASPLNRGRAVSWEKPASVVDSFANYRWRKYERNLDKGVGHRFLYARYLCRSWNAANAPPKLNGLEIYYMREKTPPPGEPEPEPTKDLLWRQRCGDNFGSSSPLAAPATPAPPSTPDDTDAMDGLDPTND